MPPISGIPLAALAGHSPQWFALRSFNALRSLNVLRVVIAFRHFIALIAVTALMPNANKHATAQVSIDTPRTTLAPINGITGSVSPGAGGVFGAPSTYPNQGTFAAPTYNAPGFRGFGNTTPRLNFGAGGGSLFDPYATGIGGPTMVPSNVYPTPSFGAATGGPFQGMAPSAGFGQQAPPLFGGGGFFGGSPTLVPSTGGSATGFGNTIYPPSAIPSGGPSTLFPGGLFTGRGGGFFGGGGNTAFRFLQGPRIRHTFINAGNGRYDLETNDTDISVAFAIPNFLSSQRPLFVVPSFSLHLWDGPRGSTGSDLPANAYSGFLDFGWQSDPNQMIGLELGARVGAFTEFDLFNSDSLRLQGKLLGAFRLTPYTTVKGGVYYLDRNRIKLLPAGGLLWQPNPYTRFDIFFPQPKIARYWRTVGTRDVWWYATGDYGGDNWTIRRDNGDEESVDINDIRVMFGFEWGQTDLIRVGRRTGFFEVGYVFDREVIYRESPEDNFTSDDAFMVRLGVGY